VGRKNTKAAHEKIPKQGISGWNLFLNIFFEKFNFDFLIFKTAKHTKIKAVKVPIFTISAKLPRGINHATTEMIITVNNIILTGVCVFLLITESFSGKS